MLANRFRHPTLSVLAHRVRQQADSHRMPPDLNSAALRLTPSRLKPVLLGEVHFHSGTGFSREEASLNTLNSAALRLTPSRLKPVLLGDVNFHSGTGFSREEASLHTLTCAARHPTLSG